MADTASLIARVKTEGVTQATDQLEDFTTAAGEAEQGAKKLGDGVNKAQPKMQRLGNIAGQAGFQISDFVVQIQSGTSAFVAFTQQGSQLFGAINPLLGLVATLAGVIGGALYNSLSDATASSKELKAAASDVTDALHTNADGAFEVSDALTDMASNGASAAEIQNVLAKATQGVTVQLQNQYKALVDANTATQKLTVSQSILSAFAGQGMKGTDNQIAQQQLLAKNLGLTAGGFEDLAAKQDAFRKAQESGTRAEQKATLASLAAFTDRYKGVSKGLADLNRQTQDAVTVQREALQQFDVLDKGQEGAEKRAAEREKKKKDREDAALKRAQAAADREAKRDAAAAARQKKAEEREQKSADTFLNTLARQNSDELAAIDVQEQQKLDELQKFNQQGLIVGQQYEDAKTQIALDADAKRNALLEKQTDARIKAQDSADAFLEQVRAQNEGELAEIDRQQEIKLKKLQEFHDKGLVSEDDYQKAIKDIQDDADKKRLDSYTDTLSDTTSALKTALGEGSALYKAAAITETIINTYKAATGAYSALAPIPIVGPALGAVAAGAAVAAGLANVAKIRSAREQGGTVAAGSAFVGGERGKPEVITAAGASRVRTMEQMQQMMGGAKNNQPPQISIINQTSGRIDSVEQQQDDEGRLRLIIRETVSGDMQDSNSQISKSRRATRGQPGFAT